MDHAMVIKADAKAMGAVTALTTTVSDRWTPSKPDSRTFGGRKFSGTSECISYHATDKSDAKVFRSTRTRKPNRRSITVSEVSQRITSADLAPIVTDYI